MSEHRIIEVKINPGLHEGSPENETQSLTWQALDTVWGLMSEYAVRAALADINEQVTAAGYPPVDVDMLEFRNSEGETLKLTALISGDPLAGAMLDAAFTHLAENAYRQLAATLGLEIGSDE